MAGWPAPASSWPTCRRSWTILGRWPRPWYASPHWDPGETDTDSRTLLSLYDRYLEAARHPRIRPLVAEYDDRIEALLADVLRRRAGSPDATAGDTRRTARLVLAVIDGALLRALAEGLPVATATTAVEQLLCVLETGGTRP